MSTQHVTLLHLKALLLLFALCLFACSGDRTSSQQKDKNGEGNKENTEIISEETLRLKADLGKILSETPDRQIALLNKMIDPKVGLLVLAKPATYPVVHGVANIQELEQEFDFMLESFKGWAGKEALHLDKPTFDGVNFNARGIFLSELSAESRQSFLSEKIRAVELQTGVPISDELKEHFSKTGIEKTAVVVFSEQYLELTFVRRENRWYLICADSAYYSS